MAPEVKRGTYNLPADVYSLGLVLYEIFEGKLPAFDQIRQTVHSGFMYSRVVTLLIHFPGRHSTLVSVCVCCTPVLEPPPLQASNIISGSKRHVLVVARVGVLRGDGLSV